MDILLYSVGIVHAYIPGISLFAEQLCTTLCLGKSLTLFVLWFGDVAALFKSSSSSVAVVVAGVVAVGWWGTWSVSSLSLSLTK